MEFRQTFYSTTTAKAFSQVILEAKHIPVYDIHTVASHQAPATIAQQWV